jgi:coproporphyrinogen III oxidase-like Fe-S oxidoreductase
MQTEIQSYLAANNFQQYEVSAYALPQHQCRHNLNYWQFGDYLGIGAGAHGKITSSNGVATRNWKIKHPTSYLRNAANSGDFNGDVNQVKEHDLPFEFMLNALRLSDGFELALFEQRTGLNSNTIIEQLAKHQELGLITQEKQRVSLSERGKAMLNSMLQDYLF